jgi:type IV fimbrial biogenesis protein FimT
MPTRGFTLLELIVTLSVICILLASAIPTFLSQLHSSHLKTASFSLMESMAMARGNAVASNMRVTIAHTKEWNMGWEVFVDSNNDGKRSPDERILQSRESFTDVYIIPNQPLKKYVSFIGSGEGRMIGKSNGGAKQMGTFRVCPMKPGIGYALILSGGGRVRMNEISSEECTQHIAKL